MGPATATDATIVGTLLTAPVSGGEKYRATWTFYGASVLPSFVFDAPATADEVRNWLPSAGFAPVSNPSALPGDMVVVYDVRLTAAWGGRTVADIANALDSVPTALYLTRLEKVSLALTSQELQQQQDNAVKQAQAAAAMSSPLQALKGWLGTAGTALAVLAGVVIVGGVAYIIYKAKR